MSPLSAKFLFDLGLKQYPPIEVILGIAANRGPQGAVALNYFFNNYGEKYMDYTPTAHADIAFVPAIYRGQKTLEKPLGVFSNPCWKLFDFPVLDPDLRQGAASILQIKEHPPTEQLVHYLEVSPPITNSQACEWFELLSRHIPGLCNG